jgi:hypothetical protein
MQTDTRLLKAASASAIIFAIVLALAVLSRFHTPDPRTLDQSVAISSNVIFRLRNWLQFLSFFFVLIAFWGIAIKKLEVSRALVGLGFVFATLFVFLELFTRSIDLFVTSTLVETYAATTSDVVKTALTLDFDLLNRATFAIYFPLLATHMFGSACFALAALGGNRLEKTLSIFFFLNALRLVLRLMQLYGNQRWLAGVNRWTYVVLILLFVAIGVWLRDGDGSQSNLNAIGKTRV